MELIRSLAAMTDWSKARRRAGETIGLVPTMGALHRGHLSLLEAARAGCERSVVSIFVNPLQFGPHEDFARYPRDLDKDCAMLGAAGCDAVFACTTDEMVPAGLSTFVVNDALADRFEGAVRPGHFRGVLTIVAKLFHVVGPDRAYFGQKDAQQAALIRAMARDLDFPLEVVVRPIVREDDGLAMSSRNVYLTPEGRIAARSLSRGLRAAEAALRAGETSSARLIEAATAQMAQDPRVAPEYVAVVDPDRFAPVERVERRALLLVAAKVDGTRLLDNAVLERAP